MSDLILHHFDLSPFAEKIRLIMGLKDLTWHSVEIPMIMPKPDLTALTGGYRKTPVLQVGAEVYCDTGRIARELEQRHPQPSLFADGNPGMSTALACWSDKAFFEPGAGLSMGVNEEIPEAVLKDRKQFFNFMDFETLPEQIPHLYSQLLANAALIEDQLADGRRYLFSDAPGWGDICAYFVIWMCRNNVPPAAEYFAPFKHLNAWADRVAEFGHGRRDAMTAEEALAVARDSEAGPGEGIAEDDPQPLEAGMEVNVTPMDYGKVPVTGRLITLNRRDISINRDDPRAGNVNVHFPRAGYSVTPV
ncbi:MAG: glutathione S-transferase family protein [Gammaproteobacteria bacterium]